MKRDKLLIFISVVIILFALRSLSACDIDVVEQRDSVYSQKSESTRCKECCKHGRWVSTECCRECGGCDRWDEEGSVECRDNPA